MLKLGDFGSAHFIEMESTMDGGAVPAYGSKGVTMLYAAPETHTGGILFLTFTVTALLVREISKLSDIQ